MRALLAVPLAALAACAAEEPPAAASEPNACFRAADANGFSPAGDDRIVVTVGANRHYLLEMAGLCPHLDWSQRLALRSRGSSWICRGYDADLIVPAPGGPQLCTVRAVRRLSESEAEALRGR